MSERVEQQRFDVYFCEECACRQGYRRSIVKSWVSCELCGTVGPCNEVERKNLYGVTR